jgi:hypothetical protein
VRELSNLAPAHNTQAIMDVMAELE